MTRQHQAHILVTILYVFLCTAYAIPAAARPTHAPRYYPISTIGTSGIFSTPAADGTTYYSSSKGLFRSLDSTFSSWARQSPISDASALSVREDRPDDLLFADKAGMYRSVDGGVHAVLVSQCGSQSLTRSRSAPSVLYASSNNFAPCSLPHGEGDYPTEGTVLRSTNDGITWTVALTTTAFYGSFGGFGPVVVDPADPNHVIVDKSLQAAGRMAESMDGGRTWWPFDEHNYDYSLVEALAFDPVRNNDLWSAWGGDIEHGTRVVVPSNGDPLNPNPVITFAFDPLNGRAYALRLPDIVAEQGDGSVQPLLIKMPGLGKDMVVAPNGQLLVSTFDQAPITHTISGPDIWPLSPMMAASRAVRLLGGPLSPVESCTNEPCEYFAKGALERMASGVFAVVPLVPALLNTRSPLPVGGKTSTVTYRTLFGLHSRRTPMPAGFKDGTVAVPGGTFVPYSPTLAPASGYLVPTLFWRYLNDYALAPDGWRQDMGLPLTPAVPATVTKGKLGTRTILIQAFQRAILTYDPRNAAPFQVERANIGADYAVLFPAAVR